MRTRTRTSPATTAAVSGSLAGCPCPWLPARLPRRRQAQRRAAAALRSAATSWTAVPPSVADLASPERLLRCAQSPSRGELRRHPRHRRPPPHCPSPRRPKDPGAAFRAPALRSADLRCCDPSAATALAAQRALRGQPRSACRVQQPQQTQGAPRSAWASREAPKRPSWSKLGKRPIILRPMSWSAAKAACRRPLNCMRRGREAIGQKPRPKE